MNSHYSLALAIRDILQVVNPTEDDWLKRFQIINDLRAVVGTLEILRGATVEPFGSFVSNLFTKWGDLDISIELPNGSYISAAGKKHKQTLLLDLLKALKRRGGFHGIKYISHARVPILKCDSDRDNISCDISINNLNGQMKSKLLFWINEIDGRFRDMVLIVCFLLPTISHTAKKNIPSTIENAFVQVKEWAKAHGINDPKTGTLNSYSLSLLIIFHFQTCEPAILPPLSEIYPGNMVDALTGVRAVAEKNIEDTCGLNINRIRSDKSRRINRSSLAELFILFLAKFCDISLRASTQGISAHNGQWEDIDTNMRWQPKTYALFIEDPFDQPLNCARTVGLQNLLKIAEAFQSSHQKLTSANPNHPLAVLVRPEVLSIMSRSPVASFINIGMNTASIHPQLHRNPVGNGRHLLGTHPEHHNRNDGSQVYRTAHPAQVHQQYQFQSNPNNRINQRPLQATHSQVEQFRMNPNNGVNQGPGQASQSQVQQRWWPRSEK